VADGGGATVLDVGIKAPVDDDDGVASLQLKGVKGSESLVEMGDGKNWSLKLTIWQG
jgi:hypothetical protein